jgi:hypothetical protein
MWSLDFHPRDDLIVIEIVMHSWFLLNVTPGRFIGKISLLVYIILDHFIY